ncbi:MAG TPA: RNA polymerase sigma factor [Ktedonobacteraceae bacterium]|nr:RNA polymerase sigma factor [Ktedonobacteraceae bacterium]
MRQIHAEEAADEPLIAALYDRYALIILNYLSRYISCKEDVDDMVLDVFLAAMENRVWITWSDGEQLAWLRRIAYNKAVDYYRRTSRHPSVALEYVGSMLCDDDDYMPEHVALRNEDYALLRVHLSNLSELQQEIVRLRFGYGLRSKEIAQRLNKSDSVIRVTLSRTLNLLRRKYFQQEEM